MFVNVDSSLWMDGHFIGLPTYDNLISRGLSYPRKFRTLFYLKVIDNFIKKH